MSDSILTAEQKLIARLRSPLYIPEEGSTIIEAWGRERLELADALERLREQRDKQAKQIEAQAANIKALYKQRRKAEDRVERLTAALEIAAALPTWNRPMVKARHAARDALAAAEEPADTEGIGKPRSSGPPYNDQGIPL